MEIHRFISMWNCLCRTAGKIFNKWELGPKWARIPDSEPLFSQNNFRKKLFETSAEILQQAPYSKFYWEPLQGLLIKRSITMIITKYSHMLLNLTTWLFQSFGPSLLILPGPLPLLFLISFPNFEIRSDLWEVMGRKEALRNRPGYLFLV